MFGDEGAKEFKFMNWTTNKVGIDYDKEHRRKGRFVMKAGEF